MEDVQEFAGHLKAELLHARHEYNHSRMSKQAFLDRLAIIRQRREAAIRRVSGYHTASYVTPEGQMTLL